MYSQSGIKWLKQTSNKYKTIYKKLKLGLMNTDELTNTQVYIINVQEHRHDKK